MISHLLKQSPIRALLVFISIIYITLNVSAQTNLVLNPSFEQYTNCPINIGSLNARNSNADLWYKPDKKNAIYYNICTNNYPKDGIPYNYLGGGISYQYPKNGVAYMAIGYLNSGYHDYIQIQLTDSCKKNKKYYGEYYVSLFNPCKYGCNNIGMLFTNNVVYADTVNQSLLLANPQILSYGNPIVTDTMGWVKISGIFTAQGGEQYLTLGNFKSQANTQTKNIQPFGYDGSGYYVDDVAVYNLDSFCVKADAGRDTTIKVGDSVFIGSYTNGIDTIKWFNGNIVIDSVQPGFWVKPTSTTSYVLHQVVNGCFSSDTVVVTVKPLPLKYTNYNVISTKEKSVENVWETANEINVSHYNIERSTNAKDFTVVGKVKANNKSFNEYNFTDLLTTNYSLLTTLYYRVVGVDFDGKKTYSTVKSLQLKVNSAVSVYPNPAKDEVNISCIGIKEVNVINSLGQTIIHRNINNNHYQLDISSLPKGIYILNVISKLNSVYNEKLIVQ